MFYSGKHRKNDTIIFLNITRKDFFVLAVYVYMYKVQVSYTYEYKHEWESYT